MLEELLVLLLAFSIRVSHFFHYRKVRDLMDGETRASVDTRV